MSRTGTLKQTSMALLVAAAIALILGGCHRPLSRDRWLRAGSTSLTEVATSSQQWTGLAISARSRIFVNYPLWSANQEFALAELSADGGVSPYPSKQLNSWAPGKPAAQHWVCVQALFVDAEDRLWVLDPANPRFEGVIRGGPKLAVIDLANNAVQRIYHFDDEVAPSNSYLNDVRVDLEAGVAYITDSGAAAIVVVDLESGRARRLLEGHASTRSEGIELQIEDTAWRVGGEAPQVHVDGIALSRDRSTLYYQALTGTTLYCVATSDLRNEALSSQALADRVRRVAQVGASDGLLCGPDGAIYLTSLEANAIQRVWPTTGDVECVVRDERISWPDSFAIDAAGALYFTTAQIHRGAQPPVPYRVYRLDPEVVTTR